MNRIKEVLDEKGIKQKWLAEKLGKSYNMVNSYIQNRQQPRLEVLFEIAEILGVDAKELLKSKEFWIVKIQNQLYEELEKYLRENNVSKTELANKMGVSKGYISQILNGDFDHKLSKLIEIIMVMDKVPILNLENIDDCINIDKEIGIDKLNERFTFNITINYNNVFELEKETSKRNFEFLEQQNLFNFGNLKKANLKPVEYTLLN